VIIADTSVWVRHFRSTIPDFASAFEQRLIVIHPVIIGELAIGNLGRRQQTLAMLRRLPRTQMGAVNECLDFIETHGLYGRGIGWNDVQLLVSAKLSNVSLWSFDSRLSAAARELGVAHPSS
jgi:predicted nucleic acid-binding protein